MEWSEVTLNTGWDMPNGLFPSSTERELRENSAPLFLSSFFLRTFRNCETFLRNTPVRS